MRAEGQEDRHDAANISFFAVFFKAPEENGFSKTQQRKHSDKTIIYFVN